jgi:hypothetical protein
MKHRGSPSARRPCVLSVSSTDYANTHDSRRRDASSEDGKAAWSQHLDEARFQATTAADGCCCGAAGCGEVVYPVARVPVLAPPHGSFEFGTVKHS